MPSGSSPLSLLRKVLRFLGPRVTRIFALSLLAGVALFAVELTLATTVAAFLSVLGVVDTSKVTVPSWIPQGDPLRVLGFVVVIGSVRAALQWAQVYMQGATTDILRNDQRLRIVRWAFNAEAVSSGKTVALFNDIAGGASQFVMSTQMLLLNVTLATLLLGKLLLISPLVTAEAIAAMLLLSLPVAWLGEKIDVSATSLNVEAAKITESLLLNIKNLILMQIYGTQDREETRLRERLLRYTSRHLRYHVTNGMKYAAPQVLGVILICTIALATQKAGTLPPGQMLVYFYLFIRFVQNAAEAAKAANGARFTWSYVADLAKWWADNSHDGIRNTRVAGPTGPLVPVHQPVGWTLEKVSYSYTGTSHAVLRDVDLRVAPGQALVIVGASGSGKSTLLNLLLGRAIPTAGRIEVLLDGKAHSLATAQASLLKRVGYVGAESFLVEGTLFENLVYGLDHPPDEANVRSALEKAECHFAFELPDRLAHRLTEQGQGLSAGQKQRLGLARALLRNPKALFLDEATANLDFETENRLVKTLRTLKGQMTIIAVTHRQGLLELADQQLRL